MLLLFLVEANRRVDAVDSGIRNGECEAERSIDRQAGITADGSLFLPVSLVEKFGRNAKA